MSTREQTVVIFRTWKQPPAHGNGVIALFPDIDEGGGFCGSYERVGQHGSADYKGVVAATRAALPAEYRALRNELESAPYHYNLAVRVKWNRKRATPAQPNQVSA